MSMTLLQLRCIKEGESTLSAPYEDLSRTDSLPVIHLLSSKVSITFEVENLRSSPCFHGEISFIHHRLFSTDIEPIKVCSGVHRERFSGALYYICHPVISLWFCQTKGILMHLSGPGV